MKLSKVLFGSALALSLVFGAVSCAADDEEDAFSGDTVSFDNSYVKVTPATATEAIKIDHVDPTKAFEKDGTTLKAGVEKNTKYYYRAFKKTLTKHYDSVCTITLTPNTTTSTNGNGVAGYVFALNEEKVKDANDKEVTAYNFGVAGVRWNGTTAQAYVCYEPKAVVKENNYQTSGNFVDVSGADVAEVDFTPNKTGNVYTNLKGITKDTDGTVTVVVAVKANDDGSYAVSFYDKDALENGKIKTGATAKETTTVTALATGLSAKTQLKLARYANIYAGEKLDATYKFTDTNGAAVVFED
ncbi:MAG: hypothetical protein KBT11_08980 [Treponema sp.]|nr:hypothetical protein [Candidatus Treponema equifaecale]